MELVDVFRILSKVLLNVGIIGTIITIIIFLIAIIFDVKTMNRAVFLLSIMFIFIWLIQIALATYVLLDRKAIDTGQNYKNRTAYTVIDHRKKV